MRQFKFIFTKYAAKIMSEITLTGKAMSFGLSGLQLRSEHNTSRCVAFTATLASKCLTRYGRIYCRNRFIQ